MDLINESYITESPDLTSIIASFESKRNPINLFIKEDTQTSQYLEEKLNFIDGKIEDLREWLVTCYPHVRLNNFDYKRCLTKLIEIEEKLIAVSNMYRHNPYSKDRNMFGTCNYKVTCAQCEAHFVLNNPKDMHNFENHKHAVDILTLGQTPQLNAEDTPQPPETGKPINTDDFPIQSISNIRNHYRCLLCQVFFRGKKSLRSHVCGKSHTKKLNNVAVYTKMSDFVKHFQQLPAPYRIFQVLFDPAPQDAPSHVAFCTICAHNIPIANIPEHVTRNQTHRGKFQSIDYSFLNGYKEMTQLMRKYGKCDAPIEPENSTIPAPTTTQVPSTSAVKNPKDKSPKKTKRQHTVIQSYSCNGTPTVTTDFIPHRLKGHLKFIDDADAYKPSVCCTLCKFIVEDRHDLVAHIVSEQHKLKSRLEFNETLPYYCYFCCLCCKYFKKDAKWVEHLNSLTHQQKFVHFNSTTSSIDCNGVSIVSRESVMPKQTLQTVFKEYECTNCSLIWYGQQHSINAHKKNKLGFGDKRKPKDVTLSQEMVKLLKDEVAFAADILKASKESTDVLNSVKSAQRCCRAIEDALCPTFGEQIKAYPFGSRISGLGNIASDLDVFVDIGSMYEGTTNQNAEFQSYCVQQTAHTLRRHRDFTDICPIPQARTPIVQVFHKPTDLDCDLSFRHGLSIENTEFLRFCLNVQPKLKSLILVLKKWIRSNKFRDRISTYGISLMSIYMMQNKGYLPSLAKLRQIDPQKSKIIAGWETFNFQKPISEIQVLFPLYGNNERHLLAEFFDFYVSFDYENQVICPLLGQSIPKDHFLDASGASLPKEMCSYVKKIQTNADHEKIKVTKSICLQDPFDLSHNVTKALPIEVLVKMVILMKQSYQLIQK